MCYDEFMKAIPQRELRNRSGEILRQAEKGEQFTITVDGRPVALLGPIGKRAWVPRADLAKILQTGRADPMFRQDVGDLGGTLDALGDPWHP
jgi:prevent-host-death family protein